MTRTSELKLDPYERLANTLNKIPNGFPIINDGTHLRVLQWIFTPEEAELASQMKLRGETIEELATRLNLPIEGLVDRLEIMESKGQIYSWNSSTGRQYALMPFVVGIYEEQLDRMDSEFAQLIEEFFQKSRCEEMLDAEPELFRVIPINRAIKTELTIYPFEDAEQMIKQAKSWGLRECICKKQQELVGNPCKYPKDVCLSFSPEENAYENSRITQPITLERSLEILRQTEEAGLIHCSMNIQTGHSYICNCCTCCCGVLRGLVEFGQPRAFVNSNYVMKVDSELCVGCGLCIDRCQFNALQITGDVCVVNHRCIGCGVCAIECPEGALSLISRDSTEISKPPETMRDWMIQRTISRQVDPSDLL